MTLSRENYRWLLNSDRVMGMCLEENPDFLSLDKEQRKPIFQRMEGLLRRADSYEHRIGDKVKVSKTSPYFEEWRGWSGFVCGIEYKAKGLEYTVCEEWPPHRWLTNGFDQTELSRIDEDKGDTT